MKKRDVLHPGIVLKELYLKPRGLTQAGLARRIRIEKIKINSLCRKENRIDPDLAVRLEKFFGIDYKYWMQLQFDYSLHLALKSPKLVDDLQKIIPWQETNIDDN